MHPNPLSEPEIQSLYTAGDAAHDFDHVQRVTRLATHIAQAEGADVDVVRAAALLHDVPVAEGTRRAHHLAAAAFARSYLLARWGEDAETLPRIDNVVHAIEAHRFRDQSIQPQTLEAQCLYDADKLDSIGAIGVGRAFAFAGSHANRLWTEPWRAVPADEDKPSDADYTPVHEYVYKLRRLLSTLHTETAKAMGARRHAFMETFFEELDDEMMG
ncbi:MAG: HD domain-containing protein [Caldilineaceae bacterium]